MNANSCSDNRLWVQRVPPAPPRPPKKTSLKAKRAERAIRKSRPPPKKSHKKKIPPPSASPSPPPPKEEEIVSGPRKRTQVAFYGNLTPTVAALKRGGSAQNTPTSTRGTRSSARQHRNNEMTTPASNRSAPSQSRGAVAETPSKTRATPLPLGTRVSRRLRDVDDEWQKIPDEWLGQAASSEEPAAKVNGKAKGKAKQRAADEESDLSELTDEEEHEAELKARLGSVPMTGVTEAKGDVKRGGGTDGSLTPVSLLFRRLC